MHTPLHVHGLSHRYPGATRRALDDVDLSVRPGECLALLGPNGAGKTTLIRAATGLLVPDGGTVTVAGGDPRHADVRARLGVMLQATAFPSHLTVRELVVGAALRAGRTTADADRMLADLGIDDLAGRRTRTLSGGQQRRLQLARALVTDPDLLVLDEPTEGLDLASRRATWEHLAARRERGTAILLTTHLVAEAGTVADRVAVLSAGRIVADATPTVLTDQLPDRTIHVHTTVATASLAALPGVLTIDRAPADDPDPARRDRTSIVTRRPEDVLRQLLVLDPAAHGLRVVGASLEDAVATLGGAGDARGPRPTSTTHHDRKDAA
ncbi:ABC transporter ATP-binding protein [Salsipaludibacter albus]|uniref:ABC transporter ATP-binding protein n=1 Tax=Salsipaludibacter albus TaxID=2849650 RepID=UPI001EE402FF|nr:ABC transporter ATP-binding protein [Salsipaludibacter albus]MBY5163690.1 ABC transporter ATP-binding protein [Salsipaludibacter albus]